MKRLFISVLISLPILAQNPTLSVFMNDFYNAMSTVNNGVASLPRPRITLTTQVLPASSSWISAQPSCTPNVTCSFNNTATFNAFLDGLNRLGAKIVDVNIWLQPFACAAGYTGSLALDCSAGGFWMKTLANYDALFVHAQANGQRIRAGSAGSLVDLKTACGLTATSTEAQIESCLKPLMVAIVQRYGSDTVPVIGGGIAGYQILEEPVTLSYGLGLSANLSVSDINTFLTHVNTALKAAVPTIKTGAAACGVAGTLFGGTDSNYFTDWRNTLRGTLDFLVLDVFESLCDVSNYPNDLDSYSTMISNALAQGWEVRIGQSGPPNWCTLGTSPGDSTAIDGYGDVDLVPVWTSWISVVARWAAARGISSLAVFCPAPFFWVNTDHTQDHCDAGSYSALAMSHLAETTVIGAQFQQIVGSPSLQGNVGSTGKITIP